MGNATKTFEFDLSQSNGVLCSIINSQSQNQNMLQLAGAKRTPSSEAESCTGE